MASLDSHFFFACLRLRSGSLDESFLGTRPSPKFETEISWGSHAGGCSGFTYTFSTEEVSAPLEPEDMVFTRDDQTVVVDDASLEFVRGSTIDFEEEMIRSAFVVTNNPLSESACGCGSSFALKNFEDNKGD